MEEYDQAFVYFEEKNSNFIDLFLTNLPIKCIDATSCIQSSKARCLRISRRSLASLILKVEYKYRFTTADCPSSSELSYFVADDSNPCIFHWCVLGAVIDTGQ